MIIEELNGGLGNQMFQYCLYKKLSMLGKDVYLDASCYDEPDNVRKFELNKFEGIKKEKLVFSNDSYRDRSVLNCWFVVKRKVFKQINHSYEDKIGIYQPEIYDMDWVRLVGYWQNEKYFLDIREDVLESFCFDRDTVGDYNNKLAKEMANRTSVSLHVRRGDYLDPRYSHAYNNICTMDYYKKAVRYIYDNTKDPFFYIFSDDLEWVKNNICLLMGNDNFNDRVTFVDGNRGENSYLDMFLMSQCRHHIIANSTFSWWGAWLGTNGDKIVVSPNRWLSNHDTTDTICDGWIRI